MTASTYISAIETEYAGCRFRSRLEARWAVFFDHLGIPWEYEPQGFDLSWRLSDHGGDTTLQYLPDFWLPDLDVWAEVKGSLTIPEAFRLLNAAAALSSGGGGGCHDAGGNDVVLLGPIPRPDAHEIRIPWRLHMHKGDLIALPWNPQKSERCYWSYAREWSPVAYDAGRDWATVTSHCEWPPDEIITRLLQGGRVDRDIRPRGIAAAYKAARSARFEHGEVG